MIILLDIDGVLVTTPPWRTSELEEDGFLKFNDRAATNLARIVDQTNAAIVLTTTHRVSFTVDEWWGLLRVRGIRPSSISKVNDVATLHEIADRASEIEEWVGRYGVGVNFVVIDDDTALNGLATPIRDRCVLTKSLIGFDEEAANHALKILTDH